MARRRAPYRWLTASERAAIAARFGAGARVREVMAGFGGPATTARRIRDEAALARRRVGHSRRRLSFAEREVIFAGICRGDSDGEIGRALGRHRSTIGREIARCGGRPGYRPLRAERIAQPLARRPKPTKLAGCPRLLAAVEAGLGRRWSPQQIAARLRVDHPDEKVMRISHQTIYRSLYVQARGELRRQLTANLRTGRWTRRSRGRVETRGRIVDMVAIAQRPLLARLGRDRTTQAVIEALEQRIKALPDHLVKSLTWDQGRELAAHQRFTDHTGVRVYFCDPHAPWQRGTGENTNGLLRQYMPRTLDLAQLGQIELNRIAAELNGRPRKTLDWATPAERMDTLLR